MTGHARAEVGKRAPRKDKRHRVSTALEILELHPPPQLVGEHVIRHHIPDLQRIHLTHQTHGRSRCRDIRSHGTRANLGQLLNPALLRRNHHAEGDLIARTQPRNLVRIAHRERHGHRRHVPWDILMRDPQRGRVLNLLNDPAHLIGVRDAGRFGCRGRRGLIATERQKKPGQNGSQKPFHVVWKIAEVC